MKSHINEELLGLGTLAEENLLAFVKDGYFVEEIVSALRSLVDGDDGRNVHIVSVETKILTELDGVGGVKPSSRVIPTLKRSTGKSSLGNSHSFSFTT